MDDIEDFHEWPFHAANGCFLVAYCMWNFLYFRIFASLGGGFLIVWGIVSFEIALDISIWGFLLFLVSILHFFLILRRRLVSSFVGQDLYEKLFKSLLTKYEFKLLLEKCSEIQTISQPETEIVKARNELENIYFLGDFDPSKVRVELFVWTPSGQKLLMRSMSPFMCIGVLDYIKFLNSRKTHQTTTGSLTAIVKDVYEDLRVYKINIEKLEQLYKNSNYGTSIKNAIYAKMLEFTASAFVSLELEYIAARQETDR